VTAITNVVAGSYDVFDFGFAPSEVLPGFLWLGSASDARDAEFVDSAGITHILNSADASARSGLLDRESRSLVGMQLDARDDDRCQIVAEHLLTASAFIEAASEAGGRVLVHCHAGINRSAAVGRGGVPDAPARDGCPCGGGPNLDRATGDPAKPRLRRAAGHAATQSIGPGAQPVGE
jgi:hypothetical protein